MADQKGAGRQKKVKLRKLYKFHDPEFAYGFAKQQILDAQKSLKPTLAFDHYGLTRLPPEIGLLTHLEELSLHGNRLERLPEQIGLLSSLQRLNLNQNLLVTLPPQIGNLVHLRALHLERNQLAKLPIELTALQNLIVGSSPRGTQFFGLHVKSNPLSDEFRKLAGMKQPKSTKLIFDRLRKEHVVTTTSLPSSASETAPSVPTQLGHPKFKLSANGLIDFAEPAALTEQDDHTTLTQIHPELVRAVSDLVSYLSSSDAHAELLSAATQYQEEVDRPISDIRFVVLAARGIRLQNRAQASTRKVEGGILPALEDIELEALNSTVTLNAVFVLASKEGRQFVEQANHYAHSRTEDELFKANALLVSRALASNNDLATPRVKEFVAVVAEDMVVSSQPERVGTIARSTFSNLLALIGKVALGIAGMATAGVVGNAAATTGIGGWVITTSAHAVDIAVGFVMTNSDSLIALAGACQETLGWMPSLIAWLRATARGRPN